MQVIGIFSAFFMLKSGLFPFNTPINRDFFRLAEEV